MSRKRIYIIIKKEWRLLYSDLNNIMITTLVPVLILLEGILYIWLADHFGSEGILGNSFFQQSLHKFLAAFPSVQGIPPFEQVRLFLLNQFNFFLLLVPTMIAISFAAFSIVDEKLSRSIEPLLATPIKTWELLLAKALSGAIPALTVTWICALLFLAGVQIIGWGNLLSQFVAPNWYIVLFWLTPATAVLSFLLGVIGSSRARDARGAMNLSIAIILPIFALIAIQVTGVIWFTTLGLVVLCLILTGIDLIVLRLAVSLFQREAIVTKWN